MVLAAGSSDSSVPHVVLDGNTLPERARDYLERGVCFTMSSTELWPAAEAHWASADYLRVELGAIQDGVHVLANTAQQQDFCYFKESGAEWDRPCVSSVRMAFGAFLDHRGLEETDSVQIVDHSTLEQSAATGDGKCTCLYMQETLLSRTASRAGMQPLPGVGERMQHDFEQLNLPLLEELRQAGGFGRWRQSQLFVGTVATIGARSTLHFDADDGLFLQVSGVKRFRLFAPNEAGNLYASNLYPYPSSTRSIMHAWIHAYMHVCIQVRVPCLPLARPPCPSRPAPVHNTRASSGLP